MKSISKKYILQVVRQALNEDLKPHGDLTAKLVDNKKSQAKIIVKQNGIIAGLEFCKTAFKLLEKNTVFISKVKDGSKVKKGKVIAIIYAKAKTILSAERTALNFLSHASGIATTTNKFIMKSNKNTKICCTRKTTPNLRLLEKYAVKKGGGFNHRFNLSDEVMIKDNHINVRQNLRELVKNALKSKKNITVEVNNITQFRQIKDLKFKRVLFDNMRISILKKCLKMCNNKYETEYSGNVNIKNVRQVSNTKIDRISIGSLTHSSKSLDLSLELST